MKALLTSVLFLLLSWAASTIAAQAAGASATGVWARATPGAATTGAIYLTLENTGSDPDRLLGATTPVAASVQFHSNMNDNGVMKMEMMDGIDVPPGATVVLKPSNTHLMLPSIAHPLKEGETFPLRLQFQKAGAVTVDVHVGKVGQMTDPLAATPQ